MKGIGGRLLKKIKSIPNVPYLKHQERILHVHASVPSPSPPRDPSRILRNLPFSGEVEPAAKCSDNLLSPISQPGDFVDVAKLMRDLDEEDDGEEFVLVSNRRSRSSSRNKENLAPPWVPKSQGGESETSRSNSDEPAYRQPDLDSATLFDPELLAAFEEAVKHMRTLEEAKSRARARDVAVEEDEDGQPNRAEERPTKLPRTDDGDPLMEFEYKCPPGGQESAILYTTTLRGIRKTFEDCNGVRFLLESLKVKFFERDISMHMEFREELWRVLEARAIPPRLFIRGRHIGGADEVLGLHERGQLLPLLREVQLDRPAGGEACESCAGVRFVVCWECSGSRRVYGEERQCHHCNENGLVVCPICC